MNSLTTQETIYVTSGRGHPREVLGSADVDRVTTQYFLELDTFALSSASARSPKV